jgi:hypothetical protein
MCQTEDPLTGAKDNSALVRLSIVNGLDLDEVATGLGVGHARVLRLVLVITIYCYLLLLLP